MMRPTTLAMALLAWGWLAAPVSAGDPAALLTQGKLDVDTGQPLAAAKAFEAVAADPAAPAGLRAEALVRLGLVRRDQGDLEGAAQAFERTWNDYRREKDAVRLLVQAATGVLPGEERWNAIWDEIGFKVDRDDAGRPVIRVEWPGVPNEPRTYGGKKISLDLDDADLKEVLRTLVDASGGLNLVADSGIHGTVTLKVREMPWAQALDLVLASNGLVARGQGNVLTVAPPERLPTMVRSGVPGGGRRYTGEPLSLEFRDTDLMDVFRFFADATHMNIVVHPGISGKVTAQMRQVPWDRALDLVLRTNDLAANHVGDLVEIGRPDRLGTRTHFEGKPIDIDFVRVDLVESLVRIADNGGRTVAYPPGIAGKVTLKLTQVPWDQAFDVLVRLNGLAWKEEGTNIRVDRAVKP